MFIPNVGNNKPCGEVGLGKVTVTAILMAKEVDMSFEDKLVSVRTLLQDHNDSIAGGSQSDVYLPGQINIEKFLTCIKAIGGTTEDRLKSFSYEDILQCLPLVSLQMEDYSADPNSKKCSGYRIDVKPTILAKEIAKIFRGKDNEQENCGFQFGDKVESGKKPKNMSFKELVESFNPEETTNSVGKRLSEIAGTEPFIVYESGRKIDVPTTLSLLEEIKQGYQGRTDITVKDQTKKVYKIGELPNNFADENPFYPGSALRPDGTCSHTGKFCGSIPLTVRQLIYLAVKSGELRVDNSTVHQIIDSLNGSGDFSKLGAIYRKAALQFADLSILGTLPQLKVILKKPGVLSQGQKVTFKGNL